MASELMGLSFLWNFLTSILGDTIKDRLKSKGTQETAKKRAYHLYKTLGSIVQKTDIFVDSLDHYIRFINIAIPSTSHDELYNQQWKLHQTADDLMYTLPELAKALDRVNPQLEIHQHDLVRSIENFRYSRSNIIARVKETFDNETDIQMEVQQLKQLYSTAKNNQKLIHEVIDNMRSFLASEFAFKDSF